MSAAHEDLLTVIEGNGCYGLFAIFIPVWVLLLLPLVSVLARETRNCLVCISQMQWSLMICVFCLSHAMPRPRNTARRAIT